MSKDAEGAMICGHDREVLKWCLRYWPLLGATGRAIAELRDEGRPHTPTWDACDNAEKLAQIIAELLRYRGRTVRFFSACEHKLLGSVSCDIVWADERFVPSLICIDLMPVTNGISLARQLELVEARTLALRLLDMPVGETAEDAVRAS